MVKIPTIVDIIVDWDGITVTLTDENENPLEGKEIVVRIKNELIIVGVTDINGQIILYYEDAYKYQVTSSFAGDDKYHESNGTYNPNPEPTPIPNHILDPNPVPNPTPVDYTNSNTVSGKASMKKTGMPIIAVIIILLVNIGLIGYREKK